MPQIAYYLGRPASFWIAVMSRHTGQQQRTRLPPHPRPAERPVVPTAPRAKVTAAIVKQKPVPRPGLQPRSGRSRDQVAQISTRPTPITKAARRDQAER